MWKDITMYSRNEIERTPRTYELKLGMLQVIVTRHVSLLSTDWRIEPGFGPAFVLSGNKTADEAKVRAQQLVMARLADARVALNDLFHADVIG